MRKTDPPNSELFNVAWLEISFKISMFSIRSLGSGDTAAVQHCLTITLSFDIPTYLKISRIPNSIEILRSSILQSAGMRITRKKGAAKIPTKCSLP